VLPNATPNSAFARVLDTFATDSREETHKSG
jgi:hypothetical protein